MRSTSIAIFLILSTGTYAQKQKTIFTNEKNAVALFFPNTVSQALTGSEKFTFSYNKGNPQYVGLVQGVKSDRSNLLVITENGDVYSYRLAYRKVLDTLNYFVKRNDRIGSEAPIPNFAKIESILKSNTRVKPICKKVDSLIYRKEYFEKCSAYHFEHSDKAYKKRRKNGLILRLKDLIYNQNEVYAILEIENKSKIDFELDYLKIFKVNGKTSRKSSYQKMELKPLFIYRIPSKIQIDQRKKFIITLPKFTLGESEKLILEMDEFRGSRKLHMKVRRIQ